MSRPTSPLAREAALLMVYCVKPPPGAEPSSDEPAALMAPPAGNGVLLNDGTARVLALFDALPLRQREVVTLRYLDNLTDNEISRILRVSTSTVRSNASRALATLNRTIEGTTS